MSLLAMQRGFGAWLRDGGDATADAVGRRYRPGLDVYLNNYRAQLGATLETTFAGTRAWLGDDAFAAAIVTHVDRMPPSSWTLDLYGRDFPMTLAALFPGRAEVAELAWTEWAIAEAFVAADYESVDAAALASVDWDRAVLRLSPALRMADVSTNVFDLWQALAEGEVPPHLKRLAERQTLLVWRNGYSCQVRLTDRVEAGALRLCRPGVAFARLCDALVGEHGEQAGIDIAGTLLGRWFADGLVADVTGGAPPCPSPTAAL